MINPTTTQNRITAMKANIQFIRNNVKYLQEIEQHNFIYALYFGLTFAPSMTKFLNDYYEFIPSTCLISRMELQNFDLYTGLGIIFTVCAPICAYGYWDVTKRERDVLDAMNSTWAYLEANQNVPEALDAIEDYLYRVTQNIEERKKTADENNNWGRPILSSLISGISFYSKGTAGFVMANVATACIETAEAIRDYSVSRKPGT